MSNEMKMKAVVEKTIRLLLDQRETLAAVKKDTEEELKTLDDEIKVFMIQNEVVEFKREDGMRIKIANGTNTTIIQKRVIDTLVDLGFDPDQIKWFLTEVTKETPYDFVDMRRVKVDE